MICKIGSILQTSFCNRNVTFKLCFWMLYFKINPLGIPGFVHQTYPCSHIRHVNIVPGVGVEIQRKSFGDIECVVAAVISSSPIRAWSIVGSVPCGYLGGTLGTKQLVPHALLDPHPQISGRSRVVEVRKIDVDSCYLLTNVSELPLRLSFPSFGSVPGLDIACSIRMPT